MSVQLEFPMNFPFVSCFQISVVSECGISRVGELSFNFDSGGCGTFMVKTDPVILLCFSFGWDIYGWNGRKCKILKQDNANSVGTITDVQFQIDDLPDSIYDHIGSILANYRGFPLALGGLTNTKLEMFDSFRNLWMNKTDYPYFPSYRMNRCISLVKKKRSIENYISESQNIISTPSSQYRQVSFTLVEDIGTMIQFGVKPISLPNSRMMYGIKLENWHSQDHIIDRFK